jgi:hypothetical protein
VKSCRNFVTSDRVACAAIETSWLQDRSATSRVVTARCDIVDGTVATGTFVTVSSPAVRRMQQQTALSLALSSTNSGSDATHHSAGDGLRGHPSPEWRLALPSGAYQCASHTFAEEVLSYAAAYLQHINRATSLILQVNAPRGTGFFLFAQTAVCAVSAFWSFSSDVAKAIDLLHCTHTDSRTAAVTERCRNRGSLDVGWGALAMRIRTTQVCVTLLESSTAARCSERQNPPMAG